MPTSSPLYLDTTDAVEQFASEIAGTPAIALDTEGASFHRFVDRIYLLQLSTEDHEAIIDPLPIGTPSALGALLENRGIQVVLHDADYDLRLLNHDYGWRVNNLFDTRVAAQMLGIRTFGLAALLEHYFGLHLDKKFQRADWSMRPLSPEMLDYAAHDTRHLLALRDRLTEELVTKGRLHWAREEFERAEDTRWEQTADGTSFLRIKGARDLSRRELARLRELVKWRDSIASELDRATFRVAGNEVLLELARQAPETDTKVHDVRGFPRSMSDARTQGAIQAIQTANTVAEADLPRFPKAPRWEKAPDLDSRVAKLKTVRDKVAEALEMDPGVLCARERIEAVARKNPETIDDMALVPGLRRWQVEVLGDDFLAAAKTQQ